MNAEQPSGPPLCRPHPAAVPHVPGLPGLDAQPARHRRLLEEHCRAGGWLSLCVSGGWASVPVYAAHRALPACWALLKLAHNLRNVVRCQCLCGCSPYFFAGARGGLSPCEGTAGPHVPRSRCVTGLTAPRSCLGLPGSAACVGASPATAPHSCCRLGWNASLPMLPCPRASPHIMPGFEACCACLPPVSKH